MEPGLGYVCGWRLRGEGSSCWHVGIVSGGHSETHEALRLTALVVHQSQSPLCPP